MPKNNDYILVAGDVIKDVAVYKGDHTSLSDNGAVSPHLSVTHGGAKQLHNIIQRAIGTKAKFAYKFLSNNAMAFPDEFAVYTLWKLQEGGLKKDIKESGKKPSKVWRLTESLGYVPTSNGKPCKSPMVKSNFNNPPAVLVIDDANLTFRSMREKERLWPDGINRNEPQPEWIVYKMSHPVAQGDLWREITFCSDNEKKYRDNLIVITSADELRLGGAAISRGYSWERTLTELKNELENNIAFMQLIQCSRYLVINFGCVATVLYENNSESSDIIDIINSATLVYDPTLAEGQWKTLMQDSHCPVYGVMNTFTASIALNLFVKGRKGNYNREAIIEGMKNGLTSIRLLRLHGHGPEKDEKNSICVPEFPYEYIAQGLLNHDENIKNVKDKINLVAKNGYQVINFSKRNNLDAENWTLLSLSETPFSINQPVLGLAHSYAIYGEKSLLHIPYAKFGKLLSVDRNEIETLRSLKQMIEAYRKEEKPKRPLCLAAFGPPGAGKSFGITQIANEILGKDGKGAEILTFNLSQYNDPHELIGAFHQVRDKVLQGDLPVVFWDEFDSHNYKWLQYLLSPMQDGTFQANELIHTIGKCIFVFAGGTSWDFETFGPVPQPKKGTLECKKRQELYIEKPELQKCDERLEIAFRLKKGPDFMSRLDGHINVLGPNPRMLYDYEKRSWSLLDKNDIICPVRRAILLRNFLGAKTDDILDIDRDLLRALLMVPIYNHGARSMEKVISPLAGTAKPFRRASLPPPQVLNQHIGTIEYFDDLYKSNLSFRIPEKLDLIAAAIMENYNMVYGDDKKKYKIPDMKMLVNNFSMIGNSWNRATNIAAAKRLPEVLAIAGLQLEEGTSDIHEIDIIKEHINHPHHLQNLAKEEHNLWVKFHRENNWGYIKPEDVDSFINEKSIIHNNNLIQKYGDESKIPENELFDIKEERKKEIKRLKEEERLHTLLKPFDELPDKEKEKDYSAIKNYQKMADLIGYKITFLRMDKLESKCIVTAECNNCDNDLIDS